MLLGDDLLVWLVLALSGAMFVGNVVALARPPDRPVADTDLSRAPFARSVVMAAVGLIGAIWAIATLVLS